MVLVKRLMIYYTYLLVAWGVFRYFVSLPAVIEELWFKPLLWLVPLFWWNLSLDKKRVDVFGKDWLGSLIWGLGIGLFYWFVLGNFRIHQLVLTFELLVVATATAITEELVFSGFVLGYLERFDKKSWWNLLLVSGMTTVLRLPILTFVYGVSSKMMFPILLLVAATSLVNGWIRQRTGNVTGSIVARACMNLVILG